MRLTRFIDETCVAEEPHELFRRAIELSEALSFPWVAYASPTHHGKASIVTAPYPTILTNYPTGWLEQYYRERYERIDPVISNSWQYSTGFKWADVYRAKDTTDEQKQMLNSASEFGLRSGVSIPLFGPNSSLAIMSFARQEPIEVADSVMVELRLAAYQFHSIASEIIMKDRTDKNKYKLSRRECECLYWAALGKSSWDISKIIGISESTVNYHIKNTMYKLGTSNRIFTVVKAIKLGLVNL